MRFLTNTLLLNVIFTVTLSATEYGAESNPTGNPIGGGKGYSNIFSAADATDPAYVVDTKAELLSALTNAGSGDIIFVSGDIDLSRESNIEIPAGVTLAGNRGEVNGSTLAPGALLYSTYTSADFVLFKMSGAGARVTGLRIKGPDAETGDYDYNTAPKFEGIYARADSLEIDNCELWGWNISAIKCINGATATHIHHNYIHHNRRVGWGYGVVVYYGAVTTPVNVLIEANLFDFNRHSIASSYNDYGSYEARYNIQLTHSLCHDFDRHTSQDLSEAGHDTIIHHNTFRNPHQTGVRISGQPCGEALVYNNWFYHADTTSTPPPIVFAVSTNCSAYDNYFGLSSPAGTTLPEVNITAVPTIGTNSLNVAFSASGTGLDGYYLWDFGDGTKATGAQVNHTYTSVGRYSATVMGRNSAGVPALKTIPVTVRPDNGKYVLSAWVKDGCRSTGTTGYYKKYIIINDGTSDHVIWSDDVAGDEGWQHVVVDITSYVKDLKEATLKLRVKCESSAWDPANSIQAIKQLDVYWDDVIVFGAKMANGDFETFGSVWDQNETTASWYCPYETAEVRSGNFSLRITHPYEYTTTTGSYAEISQNIQILNSDHRLIGHWRLDEGNVDIASNLCGSWCFDEGSGATVQDSSTNSNTGTVSGASWTSGIFDQALSFDGTDDYVACGDPADGSLDFGTGDFTLAAWIKLDPGYNSNGYVIDKGALGYVGYAMGINADKQLRGHIQASGGSSQGPVLSGALSENVWHHVAIVFDRDDKMHGYVDGRHTGSAGITGNTGSIDTHLPLYIGKCFYYGNFNGSVDDVKIYNRALTEDEISKVMHKAKDSSMFANDGMVENADQSQCWVPGKLETALDFDGTDDYLDCGNDEIFNLNVRNKFTVSFWIKPDDLSSYQGLIGKWYSGWATSPYQIIVMNDGRVKIAIGNGTSSADIYLAASNFSLGQWTHIGATYDGSILRGYVNGEEETSIQPDYTLCSNSQPLVIGKYASYYFNGNMDDVRIYDENLTASEVWQLYYLGAYCGLWHFNDGSGSTAIDDSIYSNDGTVYGAIWTTNGILGNALEFDGTDDYVNCGDPLDGSLDFGTSDFTVSLWLKTNTAAANYQGIIGKINTSTWMGWGLQLNLAGTMDFYINQNHNYISGDYDLRDGFWHHIATTRSGQDAILYIDGQYIGKVTKTTNADSVSTNSSLTIAKFYLSLGCSIDEVSIYPGALDLISVLELYRAGL